MKRIIKMLVAVLCLGALALSMASCSSSSLSAFAEDTDEGKSVYYVGMDISGYGIIIVELDGNAAPKTVENFVKLVREDFYDGLTFHRVMENFMIQGGDPKGDGTGGSKDKIPGEFSLNGWYNPISHERGVISMARSNAYDSASSQFFICNANSYFLDGSYAAFGRVVEGMDVVDAITANTAMYGDSNGAIAREKYRAVIKEMKVIVYE